MHGDDATPWELPDDLPVTDRWILSRLQRVIDEVRRGIEEYRFNEAGSAFYQFFWHEFCDWYLEMIKPALSPGAGEVERQLQRAVLIRVYETILALGHPFIPFITEELWHALPGERGLLYDRPYPAVDVGATDEDVEDAMAHLMEVIRAVRNIRSELNVPPGKKVEVRLKGQAEEQKFLRDHEEIVRRLARAGRVAYVDTDYIPVKDATAVVNDIEVCLPLEGLIDFGQEEKRLRKEVEKANAEYARVAGQLGNARFTAKAPPDIVDALRDREKTLEQKIAKLGKNLELVSRYLA
jgi:valyl-tRNA synthetase